MEVINPCVSIIIPAFNAESSVKSSIDSILKQSLKDIEIIAINDASSDSTTSILHSISEVDSRLKVVDLIENSGPAVARNVGIKQAKGRYIAFCDSDDLWDVSKLDMQLAALMNAGAAICFTSYMRFDVERNMNLGLVSVPPLVHYKDILKTNMIGCSTALYDTYVCGKVYFPTYVRHEDFGLWLSIMRSGHAAIGINKPLVRYSVRKGSVSSNKFKAAGYHWSVLRKVAKLSFFYSACYFSCYIYHAIKKRIK